jgi:hypothetical protein
MKTDRKLDILSRTMTPSANRVARFVETPSNAGDVTLAGDQSFDQSEGDLSVDGDASFESAIDESLVSSDCEVRVTSSKQWALR